MEFIFPSKATHAARELSIAEMQRAKAETQAVNVL